MPPIEPAARQEMASSLQRRRNHSASSAIRRDKASPEIRYRPVRDATPGRLKQLAAAFDLLFDEVLRRRSASE
jgi:hypothetical protein